MLGVIPDYVIYAGAIILILCIIYTSCCIKEMPPHIYADYHSTDNNGNDDTKAKIWALLNQAPKTFWAVGLVQVFVGGAFM